MFTCSRIVLAFLNILILLCAFIQLRHANSLHNDSNQKACFKENAGSVTWLGIFMLSTAVIGFLGLCFQSKAIESIYLWVLLISTVLVSIFTVFVFSVLPKDSANGTWQKARNGYWLNQFSPSLQKALVNDKDWFVIETCLFDLHICNQQMQNQSDDHRYLQVVYPVDLSDATDQNKRYEYTDYNFNISMFWSPYLVKTEKTNPSDVTRPFNLFLDEFDEHWTRKIQGFDYVIISAGHWFFRPTYFYLNQRLVGCLYCPEDNVSHLTSYFSYRRAFRTAFRAINDANNPKGVTFLRTFAPSHFEGGPWDKGGDCARTRPFKRNETVLKDYSFEMYMIQLEELRIAQRAGRRNGLKIRLFDATKPMLLRPDGHPSKYGHWLVPNVTLVSDCVHWCLPGPIDSWNDFLQELMKREIRTE